MGNCGGNQKELTLEQYMQKHHPPLLRPSKENVELTKKVWAGLQTNAFQSQVVDITSEKYPLKEPQAKMKINENVLTEGLKIGNKSSITVYQINQERRAKKNNIVINNRDTDKVSTFTGEKSNANPFDINLLDMKVTKNSIRIYEDKNKALATHSKPLIAIPLNAVKKVERTKFDIGDDQRMDKIDHKTSQLNKNLFEIELKDEFLPIYTHQSYSKMYKETSVTVDLSPDKRKSGKASTLSIQQSSPSQFNGSTMSKGMGGSKILGGQSPSKTVSLDVHKKTGVEIKDSPSKSTKFAMKYINNYSDVGPVVANQTVTYDNLMEMSKLIDKKEMWIRNDLRLIFAIEDSQIVDESIEQLNKILRNE